MDKVNKAYEIAVHISKPVKVEPVSGDITICALCQQDISELPPEQKELFLEFKKDGNNYITPVSCHVANVFNGPQYGIVRCALKYKR